MTLYVVTSWSSTPTATTSDLQITTDLPTHLYLANQPYRPTQSPRLVRTRGIDTICGFYWHWGTPDYTDQAEPGDTTTHTWSIPNANYPDPIWVTPTETAPIVLHAATSIPMPLYSLPPEAPVISISLKQTGSATIPTSSETFIEWDTILYNFGFPAPSLPATAITLPNTGLLLVTAQSHWTTLWPGIYQAYALVIPSLQGARHQVSWDPLTPFGTLEDERPITRLLTVTAGETISLRVFQDSGQDATYGGSSAFPIALQLTYLPT